MNKWFSNFTKDTTPQGRAVFNTALLFVLSAVISLPFSLYTYLQTGSWQIIASTIGLVILSIVAGYAAQVARHNQPQRAAFLLIGIACLQIPFASGLIAGMGMILGLSLFLINATIAGQTLEGRPAFITLITALLFSLLAIFIDLFASWDRITIPVLETFIPLITSAVVIVLGVVTIRQFPTYSLRTKLIAVILSIAVISISTVSFVTYLSVTYQLNITSRESLTTLANTTSDQIADRLLQNKDRLNILALNKFVQDNVESGYNSATTFLISTELVEFQGAYPNMSEVAIADQTGTLISSTSKISSINVKNEIWWQKAWNDGQGEIYISEPFFDEGLGSYVIQMSIPMPAHGEDRIIGVVVASINLREFADILSKNQADLLFANSQIMGHESLGLIQILAPEDLASLATITQEGFEEIVYEGEENLIRTADVTSAEAAIQSLNWTVIVHKDITEVRAPIKSSTQVIFLTAIGLLLVIVFVAFMIGNQFLRPIETLTTAAKKLAEGDFTARANVSVTDEIGALANSFNTMSAQVNDLISTLEQRVTDRTKALSTSTEVSRRLSTILDEKQLVTEVVNQVKNAFNYYHVHIYLMDEKQEKLIMAGGTGEAGSSMLSRRHSISVGKGLVGRAGETNAPILVSDTANNPDWLPNPLLPDTHSEIAVPISVSNQVLGVLDVQQNVVDGLKREDVDLLQSIANQAAIALQNSRTLVAVQGRASREQLIASINQKILSENSVDSALQVAVREIGRALGTRTQIKLKTPNSEN